jgi:hypothetical protein
LEKNADRRGDILQLHQIESKANELYAIRKNLAHHVLPVPMRQVAKAPPGTGKLLRGLAASKSIDLYFSASVETILNKYQCSDIIDEPDPHTGCTALMYSILTGSANSMEALQKAGATYDKPVKKPMNFYSLLLWDPYCYLCDKQSCELFCNELGCLTCSVFYYLSSCTFLIGHVCTLPCMLVCPCCCFCCNLADVGDTPGKILNARNGLNQAQQLPVHQQSIDSPLVDPSMNAMYISHTST